MFFGVPLALASYWGLLVLAPVIGGLVARLLDEERYLVGNLVGYAEYRSQVQWRLVPGIW
jgi:protein-S-isoprenylcysteine O-methyltransferase Ste14